MPTPLLFLSDAPSCSSGLGRITRDLATRVAQHMPDVFDVACVGYGGSGNRDFPFHEYHLHTIENWLVPELPVIWENWCHGREGVLFAIWDASRLYWLGMPQTCPNVGLRKWLEATKIKKWLYGAIDAEGPNGKLSTRIADTYKGFDRLLDYSAFSCRVTGNTEHLPHGVDTSVFYPRDHKEAREAFAQRGFNDLTQDSLLIGIVATNQARKNWQLGMETCKILLDRGHDVRLWCHLDILDRHWSISNLIADYGLIGRVAVTLQKFTDEQMALLYSACDITLSIAPEGFGFSSAESLACGVPPIAGSYGAQSEFVPPYMLIKPIAYHYEGAYCSKRPVHDPAKWADRVENMKRPSGRSLLPQSIDWSGPTLWPAWESWFRRGL